MLYYNRLWTEDIDRVLEVVPEVETLGGRSVMITGAAGLICSALVDVLFRFNDTHEMKIKILAAGRGLDRMSQRFGRQLDRPDFTFVPYDAARYDNRLDFYTDYIIHGASNASPEMIVQEPVETMMSNFVGLKTLLDYARIQGSKRILYISSSEVYGKKNDAQPYREDQYGYIDLLNPRNAYSVGKRATETLCMSYNREYNVEAVIVRPGHIYGPTASLWDNRVSSAWAYAVARGEDVVMKSDGTQIRSYCYCLDCASAILKVLLAGESGCAYNVSNPDSIISIREMAEILTRSAGVKLRIEQPSEEEKRSFNPMQNSSLESDRLIALGWKGCFDAEEGFEHTVKILKEILCV